MKPLKNERAIKPNEGNSLPSCHRAEKIRQLIKTLSEEFETLQQHHEAHQQQSASTASSAFDIDTPCNFGGKQEACFTAIGVEHVGGQTFPVGAVSFDSMLAGFASGSPSESERKLKNNELHEQKAKKDESLEGVILEGVSTLRLEYDLSQTASGHQGLSEDSDDSDEQGVERVRNGRVSAVSSVDETENSEHNSARRSRTSFSSISSSMPGVASTSSMVFKSLQAFSSKKFGKSTVRLSQIQNPEGYGAEQRKYLLEIYASPWFETFFAVIIAMNALVMCAEFQYEGDQLGHQLEFKGLSAKATTGWTASGHEDMVGSVFSGLDWAFGVIFTLELMFKCAVLSIRVAADIWNYLDFAVVAFFILEKIVPGLMPVDAQWLRIFRLGRVFRLVKLARSIEGFDHLYLMTTAIQGSVRILTWALALLGIVQLTLALVIGQVLRATYFEDETKSEHLQHEVYKYFGTFSRSLLSMFEVTLANWPPICRLLSEEVSEWFMLLCVLHKLTIGFAVLGVINGVFMQETFQVASSDDVIMVRQKTKAMARHRANMLELFSGLDQRGDGKVHMHEFCALANFPSVTAWLASMDIRTDELDTMFKLMDTDNSGAISFEEMMYGMEHLRGQARSIDLFSLRAQLMKLTQPGTKTMTTRSSSSSDFDFVSSHRPRL